MLKVLFKNAITSPAKLLALCFVVYLATISFAVVGFLLLLSMRWLMVTMKKKAKAIEAAEAEAETARAEAEKLAASRQMAANGSVQDVPVATASNDSVAAPMPMKRYAKSAVIIPFKTGTQ
ncbi:hypothetical protein B0G80_9012 [Paraburkholderia sp. BL6669N2]|uniref:hypothetical protein n=1 Tax=Paraburkholderia sp. BL6669N2 TaxID=1938807 RepID=UPI000E236D2D|nr:hypothetical protein [Paraburkholderia sp. BL6669N2]REG45417.1 hypothetical protein B0G80_9012 [Paraburkholderia sp. BL6669N2]